MRRLIESTLVSLDGVIEHPERWAVFDDEAKALAQDDLRGYEAFLMGRTTYDIFHAAWSPVRGDPYLDAPHRRSPSPAPAPSAPAWSSSPTRSARPAERTHTCRRASSLVGCQTRTAPPSTVLIVPVV